MMWQRENLQCVGDGKWVYKADDVEVANVPAEFNERVHQHCPSIHMPRWACRFEGEIVEIGVERMWDITDEGAINEGIEYKLGKDGHYVVRNYIATSEGAMWLKSPKQSYLTLFAMVNGDDVAGKNPFVWVVKYKGRVPGRVRSYVQWLDRLFTLANERGLWMPDVSSDLIEQQFKEGKEPEEALEWLAEVVERYKGAAPPIWDYEPWVQRVSELAINFNFSDVEPQLLQLLFAQNCQPEQAIERINKVMERCRAIKAEQK